MKFCTTCGRTYEDPEIDICPHDGTPLFGMAGSEGNDLPDEDVEPGAGEVEASSESVDLPGVIAAQAEIEPVASEEEEEEDELVDLPAPAATSATPAVEEEREDDLFTEPSEPLFQESDAQDEEQDDGLDDLFGDEEEEEEEDELVDLPASAAPVLDEPVEGDPLAASERALYGAEEEEQSLLSDDSEATPDTAPVLSDELFGDEREREFDIPGADDAASIQISEALDTTLDDLGEDSEPEGDVSLADAYQPTSIPKEDEDVTADRMADPLQDDSSGGRTGLLLVLLLLILCAGAAWYFIAGPGATPEEPTPPVGVETDGSGTQADGAQTPPVAQTPDAGVNAATVDAGAQADMGAAAQADSGATTEQGAEKTEQGAKNEASPGIAPPPVKKDPPPVKKEPAPVKKTVAAPKKTTSEPKKTASEPKKTEPAKTTTPPVEEPAKKEELKDELDNLLE